MTVWQSIKKKKRIDNYQKNNFYYASFCYYSIAYTYALFHTMELGFSLDISSKNHKLSFNYCQTFHKWDAIYIDLFKEFQTTLNPSEKYIIGEKKSYKNTKITFLKHI